MSNAHTIRAVLLASATVTSMRGLRAIICSSHEPGQFRIVGPMMRPASFLAAGRIADDRVGDPAGDVPAELADFAVQARAAQDGLRRSAW